MCDYWKNGIAVSVKFTTIKLTQGQQTNNTSRQSKN